MDSYESFSRKVQGKRRCIYAYYTSVGFSSFEDGCTFGIENVVVLQYGDVEFN